MMKAAFLLIFLTFLLTTETIGQTNEDYYYSLLRELDSIEYVHQKRYIKKMYSNGQVKKQQINLYLEKPGLLFYFNPEIQEWFFRNGQPKLYAVTNLDGKRLENTYFHKNGTPSVVFDYDYDKNNKIPQVTAADSLLPYKSWYKKKFYKKGQIKFEGFYYQDGLNGRYREHGPHLWYHKDGQLKRKIVYEKGEKS